MFQKLVAIEPVSLIPSAEKALWSFARQVVMYPDIPADDDEIIARIGDADAVLLSYTSRISRYVLECCPNVRYIGMCCSLYSPESANVDIRYAHERGITVTGIRDYGDEGVVEYVVSELVRCLHGFGQEPWEPLPREITGLKVGIVGLGKSGGMIADALKFFGAEISYYARTEKEAATAKGYRFLPLAELLAESEVVCCCLNKNTVLLHEEEFRRMGHRKILFNTGLSPAWDEEAFAEWLEGDNLCFCDTVGALGNEQLLNHPHVRCMQVSTGRTRQAFDRLSAKVLANLSGYRALSVSSIRDIRIVPITENKKRYLRLLLLADEQESMIDRYLERGDLFAMQDGGGAAIAVAVVTVEDSDTVELKNLAVAETEQGRGYGRRMIEHVCRHYSAGGYGTMLVGTGEVDGTIGFYKHCGFSYSHRVKGFFTANYDHPIYEDGVLLEDMVYLKRKLVEDTPRTSS